MPNRTRAAQRVYTQRRRTGTDWGRLVSVAYVVVAAGTKVLVATVSLSNPGIGETVRRTRGRLSIESDQAAAFEDQVGAFGMIVVNDLAIAAGVASIPGPVTDQNDDGWFVWVPFGQSSQLNAADVGFSSREYEFDSKAMRRVEEGFTVAVVVENASPTDGLAIWHGWSQLSSRQ